MSEDGPLLTGQGDTGPGGEVAGGPAPEESTDALLTGQEADEGADQEQSEPAEELAETVPEKYEAFKMPEGFTIDPEDQTNFEGVAREMKLSQENAQKLIDLASNHVQKIMESNFKEWKQQQAEWKNALEEDKEFGGPKFKETLKAANRMLSKFGDRELIQDLSGTGFCNNAGLVRMFARIDKLFSEDRTVEGRPAGEPAKTPGQIMYPGMVRKQE